MDARPNRNRPTARAALGATLAALAACAVLPAASAAHPGHDHEGIYRINPEVGPSVPTHGPDPAPPTGARALQRSGFAPGSPEREPVCAQTDSFRILYARPATAPDRYAEAVPQIRAIVRRMNAVLSAESVASGGPAADYRIACDGTGEIAVGSFTAGGANFANVVSAARAAGYNSKANDYLIFFDGRWGGACGIATYHEDERPTADNRNNSGGGFGAVYDGCWIGETPMHEAGHLMGAVQYSAPHSTGTGGHCWEENDILCYAPDGGNLHQSGTVLNCSATPRFDCGFDDYFDAAPEPGEYLERNWNLGSPVNKFLSFGGEPPPSAEAPATGEDKWRKLKLRVPARTKRLVVRLRGGGPETDLYLRRGKAPTASRFTCRRESGKRKVCRVRNPHRGRWVAAALGPADAPARAVRIRASVRREREVSGRKIQSKQRVWRPVAG